MSVPTDPPIFDADVIPANEFSLGLNSTMRTAEELQPGQQSQILIIDDEAVNIKVTRKYLERAGYTNFLTSTNASEGLGLIQRELPDLVLLDVVMPGISGLDVLEQVRKTKKCAKIPVIILTASTDPETKLSALRLNATDFLSKPVDPSELIARVRNVLLVKAHQDHLSAYAEKLEKAVRMRTFELALSRKHIIECLARAAEYRDDDTGKHIERVGKFAGIIADQLGFTAEKVELIEQAAQLHDVGKIAISDEILKKPGKLEPEEFDLMKRHCAFGLKIIQPMNEQDFKVLRTHPELGARILNVQSAPVIQMAARIALTHHERWDGTGYPLGLAGEDIPIEGRITAVADVFDALSSARPYKAPFPRDRCFEIMRELDGKQFDPRVLRAFFDRSHDIIRIQLENVDTPA